MKKKLMNLVLASVMVLGLFNVNIVSNAATNGEDPSLTWDVTYDGSSFTSTYDAAAAQNNIAAAMPGDTVTFTVNYLNNSDSAADFYMKSDVLKTLEEDGVSGGAYSYTLKYNSGSGDTTIYDSATLGGDNTDVVGLMQAAGTNDSYFYVGNLASGNSGYVTISIKLDGDSQTNKYMSSLAQLGIQFGVERSTTSVNAVRNVVYTLPGGTNIVEITDDTIIPLAGPQTGDSITLLVACCVALVIGLLLIIWYFVLTRKKEQEGA